jgi:RHS repeat-associated protein
VRAIPNSPIIQTDFGYTGQRNLSGTGLMDYRARFYSVLLGRFIQPDSIIPNPANPQAFNRFSYVYNRSINFNDPSGYDPYWCMNDQGHDINDRCLYNYLEGRDQDGADTLFAKYGVTVDPNMNRRERRAIMAAIYEVGDRLAEATGRTEASEAFTAIYDPIRFVTTDGFVYTDQSGNPLLRTLGCNTGVSTITCADFTYTNFQSDVNNIVHELGHVLNNVIGGAFGNFGWTYAHPDVRSAILRPRSGGIDWQQNTLYDPASPYATGVEMSGDMFVAWVFDAWNTDPRNTV